MSSETPTSLFQRIQQRCSGDSHQFLDLTATTHHGLIEASTLLVLAERIASELSQQAPNHLILIYLDQCSTFIPVFWGCLSAGLTALPLPMAASGKPPKPYELAQLADLLESASDIAIVIDEKTAAASTWLPSQTKVRWLSFSSLLMGSTPPSQPAAAPAEIAYLLQTSGSTGLCKYAAFTGRSQSTALCNQRRVMSLFPLGSSTGIGLASALNSLSAYLPLPEAMRHPDRLLEAIESHEMQTLIVPPVMLNSLLAYFRAASASTPKRNLSSLDKLNIGSSNIALHEAKELAHHLEQWGASRQLIHFAYGLTETGGLAYGPFRGANQHQHPLGIKIGPLAADAEVRIHQASHGEPGPIEAKRSSGFLGYLNPQTFSLTPYNSSTEWFQTGDLGVLEKGELILSGRSKDTIAVNSRKISLALIENHIQATWPDQLETVIACAGPQEELILFITTAGDRAESTARELRHDVSHQINHHFGLPLAQLIPLKASAIPRSCTGKVLKQELIRHWQCHGEDATRHQASDDAKASSVLACIQETIRSQGNHAQPAHADQPLSELGLDSLSLAQMIGTLERQTGLRCNVGQWPENPTLGELARLFGNDKPEHQKEQSPDLDLDVLDQYPQRDALEHRIQLENVQMSGDVIGPHQIVRLFNAQGNGIPLAVIGNNTKDYMLRLAKLLPNHPIYYIRLTLAPRNAGSRQYLASCCVDWLEACLPPQHPILIGNCLAGIIARHVAQQLWERPHRPRTTLLLDWPANRADEIHPYPGTVLYHVHEWHWGRDPNCKQNLQAMAAQQTPRAAFYYASRKTEKLESHMDIDVTLESIKRIFTSDQLQAILD